VLWGLALEKGMGQWKEGEVARYNREIKNGLGDRENKKRKRKKRDSPN
jgi:hypothetical protein